MEKYTSPNALQEALRHWRKNSLVLTTILIGLFLISLYYCSFIPLASKFEGAVPSGVDASRNWVSFGRLDRSGRLTPLSLNEILSLQDVSSVRNLEWFGVDRIDIELNENEWPQARVGYYSPGFFDLLGVHASVGAPVGESAAAQGVYLSERFWRQELGSESAILQDILDVANKVRIPISGVLEPAFVGLTTDPVDLWIPYEAKAHLLDIQGTEKIPEPILVQLRQVILTRQPLYFALADVQANADLTTLNEKARNVGADDSSSYSGTVTALRGINFEPRTAKQVATMVRLLALLLGLFVVLLTAALLTSLAEQFGSRLPEFDLKVYLGASRWTIVSDLIIGNVSLFALPLMLAALFVFAFVPGLNQLANTAVPGKALSFSPKLLWVSVGELMLGLVAIVTVVSYAVVRPGYGTGPGARRQSGFMAYAILPATQIVFGATILFTIIVGGHIYSNYRQISQSGLKQANELSIVELAFTSKRDWQDLTPFLLYNSILKNLIENEVVNDGVVLVGSPFEASDRTVHAKLVGSSIESINAVLIPASGIMESLGTTLIVGSGAQMDASSVLVNRSFARSFDLKPKDIVGETIGFSYLKEGQYYVSGVIETTPASQYQFEQPVIVASNLPILSKSVIIVVNSDKEPATLRKLFERRLEDIRAKDIEVTGVQSWRAALKNVFSFESHVSQGILLVTATLILLCAVGYTSMVRVTVRRRGHTLAIHQIMGASQWDTYLFVARSLLLNAAISVAIVLVSITAVLGWIIPYLSEIKRFQWWLAGPAICGVALILLACPAYVLYERRKIGLRDALNISN